MSSSASAPSGQSVKDMWAAYASYVTPPLAASVAIVPVFYGFVAKSALQKEMPIPSMPLKERVVGGVRAAPTIGTIVGSQMVMQKLFESALSQDSSQPPSFTSMLGSSMLVGFVSAPLLAVFNGQTLGQSVLDSLRKLSARQTAAIVTRETSFLFALRISGPAGDLMKQYAGDNQAVAYSSAFVSGMIGSVVGHPADTALTRLQSGLSVTPVWQRVVDKEGTRQWQKSVNTQAIKQLMRGALTKSLAVGGFSVCYKLVNQLLEASQRVQE